MYQYQNQDIETWQELARDNENKTHIHPLLGTYKSASFLTLIKRWGSDGSPITVLKTDLREEAYGDDEILFSYQDDTKTIYAVDIAHRVTCAAHAKMKTRGMAHKYITADVRALPFFK